MNTLIYGGAYLAMVIGIGAAFITGGVLPLVIGLSVAVVAIGGKTLLAGGKA